MGKVAVIGAVVAVLDIISPLFIDALIRLGEPFNNDPELCRQTHKNLNDLRLFTRQAARTILLLSRNLTVRDAQNMLDDVEHPNWNDITISEAIERVLASQCDQYLQDTGALYSYVVDLAGVMEMDVKIVGFISRLLDKKP